MSCAAFGNVEELKNFTVSLTITSMEQVSGFNMYNNRFEIQPRIESIKENTLKVSFSHNYGTIMSFILQIQKRNPSAVLEVKNMNAVQRINSNIVFRSDINSYQNSAQIYNNSLNYFSINHYFSFNKEKDSFSVNIQVETPAQITQNSFSFYFGQFDKIVVRPQDQMDVVVKHEQEDDNQKRLSSSPTAYQIDESLSTKSHSPQQEEILTSQLNQFILPFFTNTTTTTTTTSRTTQDQMKIEENEETSNAQKTRQRKASKSSSSSNFNNDESSCTELRNDKKSKFDKKNVVKNFVKAFDSYFLDHHNDCEIMSMFNIQGRDALKKSRLSYEKLEKSMKYNNKMIIAIIYSEFKDIFSHFLMVEADKWIQNSSVFDKEAHRAILRDYIRAAENPRDIPKIVNLRIRNRDPSNKYSN